MINRFWKDITSSIDLLIDIKHVSISQWEVNRQSVRLLVKNLDNRGNAM